MAQSIELKIRPEPQSEAREHLGALRRTSSEGAIRQARLHQLSGRAERLAAGAGPEGSHGASQPPRPSST